MEREKCLTVAQLIELLNKLEPDLPVTTYDNEWGVYAGLTGVLTSAPEEERATGILYQKPFVKLVFGAGLEKPPPVLIQRCRYCNSEFRSASHIHCLRCTWHPMLRIVGKEEALP